MLALAGGCQVVFLEAELGDVGSFWMQDFTSCCLGEVSHTPLLPGTVEFQLLKYLLELLNHTRTPKAGFCRWSGSLLWGQL